MCRSRPLAERGVTIIEMLIAMGVAMIILSCAYVMYRGNRALLEKPRAAYSVQDDLMAGARWLTRDLSETNLVTVRAYPNAAASDEAPGLSLLSPRKPTDDGLVLSEYGGVRWQKYIYYTIERVDETSGNLVRFEGPLSDQQGSPDPEHRIPLASPRAPSKVSAGVNRRVVARHLRFPQMQQGAGASSAGFSAALLDTSGARLPLDGSALVDGCVQIDLGVSEMSTATGKTTSLDTQLIITPRN